MNNFKNEIYLFSPESSGALVASYRSGSKTSGDFYRDAKLTERDEKSLLNHIRSYSKVPLLIAREQDCVMICTTHFASSRLCLAVTVHISPRKAALIFNLQGSHLNFLLSDSFDNVKPAERLDPHTYEEFVLVTEFVKAYGRNSGIISDCDFGHAISLSENRAELVFDFIGCESVVSAEPNLLGKFDYDFSLYCASLMCASLFAIRNSTDRKVEISFFELNNSLAVGFSTKCSLKSHENLFSPLSGLAEDLNIFFNIAFESGILHFEICPSRLDVSLVGLKDRVDFKKLT